MAGKVEGRGDNTFYFVVDEIGESSGVEDGVISDDSQPNSEEMPCKVAVDNTKCTSTEQSEPSNCPIVDMELDSDSGAANTSDLNNLEPLIKVTFRDHEINRLYRGQILTFLSEKITPCSIVTSKAKDLEVEIWGPKPEVVQFSIDATPNSSSRNRDIPHYGTTVDTVLTNEEPVQANQSKTSYSACFNCCGDHNLRDCPKPRDAREISKNRAAFQSNCKTVKASRYHLDETQKYGHLVPGTISTTLRNALGLTQDQLPRFIYKMRKLGYPPGWLEEAKVSHSGVVMYDTKGNTVLEDGDEEGEIIPDGSKDKYDITKIVDFPGFNSAMPDNLNNESSHYDCPEIAEAQSKEAMITSLGTSAFQPYKKRSLNLVSADNILEEEESNSSSQSKKRKEGSPSLEEMEKEKKKLLEALGVDDTGTPKRQESSQMVEMLGTPILQSVSPYCKLPQRERFTVDVSDVINFENLPDSTGKYETMTHIITKIRETVSKIQN